jgi:phosphoglycerol transferase MdoB-like AlkP superfamily enzyme
MKKADKVTNEKEIVFTYKFKKIYIYLFLLIISTGMIFIIEGIQRSSLNNAFLWVNRNFYLFSINSLIMFSILGIPLFFLKEKLYLIICTIICFIILALSYISQLKISFRGEPLTIVDIKLLKEGLNIVSYFNFKNLFPIILCCVLLIVLLYLIFYYGKLNTDKKHRNIISISGILFLTILYSIGFNKTTNFNITVPADVYLNYEQNGFLLGILIDEKFQKIPKPKEYSYNAINEIYNKSNNSLSYDNSKNPNIIFIMSESFWDPKLLDNVEFTDDPIPFFRKMQNDGLSGKITVPGIGGGTANTEFEVLTGITKRFIDGYNGPYNPYNTYINKPIKSLASILSDNKYESTAIHTYSSWFYRRDNVYKLLGFNKFIPMETITHKPIFSGRFIDDIELNNMIINTMNETSERDFIYTVSMQAHGPYDDIEVLNKKLKINSKLSEKSTKVIENYANLINQTDEDLQNLINTLENFNEPTIVVFFGDHIPAFGRDVYQETNFNLSLNKAAYETPFFIWSNDKELNVHIRNQITNKVNMDANYLGAYVLNLLNCKTDVYMNNLYELYKQNSIMDIDNKNPLYSDIKLLAYDVLHGNQFLYDISGYPKENNRYMLGYDPKCNNVIISENDENYIIDALGSNFTWMSEIYINGNRCKTIFKDSNRLTTFVSKNSIKRDKKFQLQVRLYNSRNKLINCSENLNYSFNELYQTSAKKVDDYWKTIVLNGTYNWELFDKREGFKIVRAKIDISQVPNYVKGNNTILEDYNADSIYKPNQSNIYNNKYIYISVSDKDSNWKDNISNEDIKQYFRHNNYTLFVADESEYYKQMHLDGNLDWEFFDNYSGFKTVRVYLGIDEQPYFIRNENIILKDNIADNFEREDESDIYTNKYLYISIKDQDSQWSNIPTKDQIKNYFNTRKYTLFINKNNVININKMIN